MKLYRDFTTGKNASFITFTQFVLILTFALSGCKVYYDPFYTDPDECLAYASKVKPYDAIIVPGFPADSGKLNTIILERVHWAYYLYSNGYTRNVIFSGAAVYTPYIESEIMRLYALELGMDDNNIFVEKEAEHTTENLYYGYKKAKELGFHQIAFATHAVQSSFMKPFRSKFQIDLDFIPIVLDSIRMLTIDNDLPEVQSAFVPNFIPLKERESVLKRLKGTRGSNVKKEMRQNKNVQGF